MRRFFFLLLIMLLIAKAASAGTFIALCYHGVEDEVVDPDGMTLATDRFIAHLTWLRENGYRPVGVDDLLAARDGVRPLPDKAVLLTFDDGYASFYSRVFPLLKAFNYPAVLALVGQWMAADEGEMVRYGDREVLREAFVSWDQVREMAASGLVEIASHTFDMHHGVIANPQRNLQPALTSRRYDPEADRYESDDDYRRRIRQDMAAGADLLERETGRRPRVIVWPYGRYNRPAQEAARNAGMEVALTLEGGASPVSDLSAVNRLLISGNTDLADFVWRLRHPGQQDPRRVVHVDLDYIYDPDPEVQEANLSRFLDRIKRLKISTVYLQAFADPEGDGSAAAVYFPNRHLPVRADLFNRVAWQLQTRAGVEVYAWMPVLGFVLGGDDLRVHAQLPDMEQAGFDEKAYRRLSPFSTEARRLITELYEDLARHAAFDGILFHDDAVLSDFEDVHPEALAAYRQAGLPDSIEELRSDPQIMEQWTAFKTRYLVQWTDHLTETVRTWRPAVRTARNLYAGPVLEPASEAWWAQNLEVFLEHYDFAALMAMPYMEGATEPDHWLRLLVERVARHPEGLQRTIFELQSVNWRNKKPLPTRTMVRQMRLLQSLGAVNFGYYPDDFPAGHPNSRLLHGAISLQTYPYWPDP
jgi:poly-beta-1,6-N-acetyl-D-glucosamine N-deacetylase